LNNIRTLSQALHPVLLKACLESTLDWYIPTAERQLGLTALSKIRLALRHRFRRWSSGLSHPAGSTQQIAVTPVSRKPVRLKYQSDALVLEVEDHAQRDRRAIRCETVAASAWSPCASAPN
jgi:hypothetical protein